MRIRMPSRKVCREFHLTYELKGAQRGVDVLTSYYGVRRMKIVVDGRKTGKTRTGKTYIACYYRNKAYFQKKEVNKRNVLHELYHHIVENKELEMSRGKEEKEANRFVREVMKRA